MWKRTKEKSQNMGISSQNKKAQEIDLNRKLDTIEEKKNQWIRRENRRNLPEHRADKVVEKKKWKDKEKTKKKLQYIAIRNIRKKK